MSIRHYLLLLLIPFLLFSYDRKPRRLSVGTEFLYHDFKEYFASPSKVHEYGWLKGVTASYDYYYPNSLYLGGDLYFEKADIDSANVDNSDRATSENKQENYEARIGLNISFSSFFIIPFVGGGYHEWTRKLEDQTYLAYQKARYRFEYVAYGARFLLQGSYLDIGFFLTFIEIVNAEVKLFSNDNRASSQTISENRSPTFDFKNSSQYCVELPIYLHPPPPFSFGIGIIPYLRDFTLKNKDQFKFLQQDQVVGPSSKTYDLGVRIEAALYF